MASDHVDIVQQWAVNPSTVDDNGMRFLFVSIFSIFR